MAPCHASIDRERRSQWVSFPSGNGSVRRVTFLHFISPHRISLSACLSHSSHPLCSYSRHVTSFSLPMRRPSCHKPQTATMSLLSAQAAAGAQPLQAANAERCFMISFPVCSVNLHNVSLLPCSASSISNKSWRGGGGCLSIFICTHMQFAFYAVKMCTWVLTFTKKKQEFQAVKTTQAWRNASMKVG